MILEILKVRDKAQEAVLRRPAKPVRFVNQGIKALLRDMAETMYAAPGVGLAAPQVGVSKRIVVIDVGDGLVELINPEIVEREGSAFDWEGCLSVPGYVGEVERAQKVRVKALDRDGRQIWIDGEGYFAVALQHEIDHLDGVIFTDRARTIRETPKPTPRVVFFGTPEFAVPSLSALLEDNFTVVGVVTQPDRPRGRGLAVQPPPVKLLAQDAGLPVLQPESVRDEQALAAIAAWNPECIVAVAYGQILPQSLLALPRLGAYNLHASLLPKYRGAAPINWAIIRGEQETGVTVQHMARRLDAGDIVSSLPTPIGAGETAGELHDRLAEAGAKLLVATLRDIFAGTATRTPQDETKATYAPMLSREDARVDWSCSALEIDRQVRGLNPWPVAHTTLAGQRLKLWRAEVISDQTPASSRPGVVLAADATGFAVATGSGVLRVTEVQAEGSRRMAAGEYLRGHELPPGTELGK
ncbi:MAG: methionyl-tRNA formyltransferase [Chloroflexota bacterium]